MIHSAVTAACLWGLPGVRTHLVAFDTDVVDLTADVDDPVELLMKVQLGGGTDIARAVGVRRGLVEQPRRAIVVLISDFYEGGDPHRLVRVVRDLVEQGSKVLGLAALDEEANPAYDRELAQRLADAGAHVGAMTPGRAGGLRRRARGPMRTDLLALTPDALAALTNRGLVKRAGKEDRAASLRTDADGTVHGGFPGGPTASLPPGGLDAARCTCGAAGRLPARRRADPRLPAPATPDRRVRRLPRP